MAEGWATAAANSALDTLLAAYPWMKLHVGAPGANGTSNAATETTRKQVSWTSASAAAASNSAQVQWTGVSGSEDPTHFSCWSASSNGNFGFSGTVTANPLTAGDNLTFATGDIDVSVPVAS